MPASSRQGRPDGHRAGDRTRAAQVGRGRTGPHAGGCHPSDRGRRRPARLPGGPRARALAHRGGAGLRRGRRADRLRRPLSDASQPPPRRAGHDLRRPRAGPGAVQPARGRDLPTGPRRGRRRSPARGRGSRHASPRRVPPAPGGCPGHGGARAPGNRPRAGSLGARSRATRLRRVLAGRPARAGPRPRRARSARRPRGRRPPLDPSPLGPHLRPARAPPHGAAPRPPR